MNINTKVQLAAAVLLPAFLAACLGTKTPEEKAQKAEAEKLKQIGVRVNKSACTVWKNYVEFDYKYGTVVFGPGYQSATAMAMKDLAEDGQAEAVALFKYLDGTACKPPKFGGPA